MNTFFSQDEWIHSKSLASSNQNEFKRFKLLDILSGERHKLGVGLISPAGYGKTTLMSQLKDVWQESEHIAVWLSLDDDDNDLGRFLKSFLRTLRDSIPLWPAGLESQLQGQLPDEKVLLHFILSEIEKNPKNYCLFIDDLHCVQNEKVLRFLLDCLQSSAWNYVLSSCKALPRGFSKLKLWGGFYELGPQHLAFTAEEIRDYFATIRNQKISLIQAEAIFAATDGWPAVIPLVSLPESQNNSTSQESELARLTHRQLEHFLSQSTFENFSPKLKEFLLQIAPLEKFCSELASSISGIDDTVWLE